MRTLFRLISATELSPQEREDRKDFVKSRTHDSRMQSTSFCVSEAGEGDPICYKAME
jgi:hypothetical protein